MKKRILLLFVSMIGMATSAGWAQGDENPQEPTTKLTTQKIGNNDCIFANGNAVTVTAASENQNSITISVDGTGESQTVANTYSLYGGSYGKPVSSSTIKMTSGTIYRIYGGGYGVSADQLGNVTGTASITIEGGIISDQLTGGGNQYAKTDKASINISKAAEAETKINRLYAGGVGYPAAKNLVRTWDEAVCGTKEVEINIENATLTEGLGCGGGQGYTYTGKSTVTIKNSTLGSFYGTLANGYADNITATLTGCTFKKLVDYFEFAAINRGAINNASFTFDGCTFDNISDANAGVGPILGWDNSDTSGNPKPGVEGKLSWKFTNTTGTPVMHLGPGLSQADIEVSGAKTKLIKFTQKTSGTVTSFSVENGHTWTLGNGLSIEDGVTFTNNGSLKIVAPDVESLTAAIKAGANEIDLVSGTTYDLTDPLVIDKPLLLTSDANTKATINGKLVVEAENASIKNLAFTCNSTGTNYWLKNAITLFGNSITVSGCAFTGSASTNQYVANGIVIFPKTADATSYAITGNTFTGFNQEVGSGEDYWTSTALLLSDNTSITKKGASEATPIPALTSWNESSLADAGNTFTNCFADYIHQTENSYVYDVTSSAKGVADGINSIEKDKSIGTIVATSVKKDDILAAVKELKPSLEGKFIVKSQDGSIVPDPNLVSTGTVYVLSQDKDGNYVITQQTKEPKVDFSTLTATAIEAGQPLSASILSGGKVGVAGVFSWKEPAKIVEKGTDQSYDVIFTPTDLLTYSVVSSTYTFKEIKQYYTVQTGKCANGHLEIVNATSTNKYEEGSKLTVKPVADAHYAFDKYLNENGFTANVYTVSENATLTAEFKPIMRTVTISITGDGDVNVNGEKKTGSFDVEEGSVLTIQAVPGSEKVLSSLKAGGTDLKSNTVTVGNSNLTIAAVFVDKPAATYVVKVSAVPNGKINLYDEDGNAIVSGSSVTEGTVVSVVAVPDLGYKLTENTLKCNGTFITDNKFIFSEADAVITAEFSKQSFNVYSSVTNGTITLKKNGETVNSGASIEYGTELTATAEPSDKSKYKLLSLVVNGKEIPNGGSFVVTAKTTVTAVMVGLATLTIDETVQTYTYDGETKAFVVKTTPAGITGFTVSYNETPINAAEHKEKAYNVTIKRDADDVYAAVEKNINGGLIIKPAQLKGVAIPTLNEDQLTSTEGNGGTYALGQKNETTNIFPVTFTPTSSNYEVMTFSVAGKGAVPCSYTEPTTLERQSAELMTRNGESSLKIEITKGSGTVRVLNGGVEANNLYVGQTITIQAIPVSTEYAADANWTVNGATTTSNTYEITLQTGTNSVKVEFLTKTAPKPKLTSFENMVYNGIPFAGKIISVAADSPVKDWDLSFDGGTPTDAGTYNIYASRKADENYLAVVKEKVGSFTIKPQEATAENPIATNILAGQALAQSVLSGTASVDGKFEWVEPTKVLIDNTIGVEVRFVPTSQNYSVKTGLTTDVNVIKTGVTIRTLNLTVVGQEFGTIAMTLDGNSVDAGATISQDQKLVVKATANTGYEAAVQIDGSTRTEYTIGKEGNVEVKVTFTKKSEPSDPDQGTDPDDSDPTVDVKSVSLDKSELTLAIKGTYTLKATVAPSDATNKNVTWKSSDDKIATVDKDGKVTAIAAGKATITVTTEDGSKTATCAVTVNTATGIEEIIANTRVYGQEHAICIESAMPVNALVVSINGKLIYNDVVTSAIQIPVSSTGIYIVKLGTGNDISIRKVSVK